MNYCIVYSGKKFYWENPTEDAIEIRDIAHSLSLQCRFNGHCNYFYSVAEHSIRVSRACQEEGGSELAPYGLLHDSAEAYVGDIVRGLKSMFPMIAETENKILEVILRKFELSYPLPAIVHQVDDYILGLELMEMMNMPEIEIPRFLKYPIVLRSGDYDVGTRYNEQNYLDRFNEIRRLML